MLTWVFTDVRQIVKSLNTLSAQPPKKPGHGLISGIMAYRKS